jgi:hypothetical protein
MVGQTQFSLSRKTLYNEAMTTIHSVHIYYGDSVKSMISKTAGGSIKYLEMLVKVT